MLGRAEGFSSCRRGVGLGAPRVVLYVRERVVKHHLATNAFVWVLVLVCGVFLTSARCDDVTALRSARGWVVVEPNESTRSWVEAETEAIGGTNVIRDGMAIASRVLRWALRSLVWFKSRRSMATYPSYLFSPGTFLLRTRSTKGVDGPLPY